MNPSVTEEMIITNASRPWDWDRLSATLPLHVIAAHNPDVTGSGMWRWNWKDVSRNPHLNWKFVEQHKTRPWNFYELSRNTQPVAQASFILEKERTFLENSPKRFVHEELLHYFPGEMKCGRSDPMEAAKEVLAILSRKRANTECVGGKRLREWHSFRENGRIQPRKAERGEEGHGEVLMIVTRGDCYVFVA